MQIVQSRNYREGRYAGRNTGWPMVAILNMKNSLKVRRSVSASHYRGNAAQVNSQAAWDRNFINDNKPTRNRNRMAIELIRTADLAEIQV